MAIQKTNMQMLKELLEVYKPKEPCFVNGDEARVIREKLELDERDVISLRNMRDTVVLALGIKATPEDTDRMSAITYIIDDAILNKGGEV